MKVCNKVQVRIIFLRTTNPDTFDKSIPKDLALISAKRAETYNFLLKELLVCLLHSCYTTTYTNNIN